MNRTREPAFRKAEVHLTRGARVAVVGPTSRTWYRDQSVLIELFDMLQSCATDFAVIGAGPFRIAAATAAEITGTHPVIYDVENFGAEELVVASQLIIAMACRVSTELEAASPYIAVARANQIPILVLFATGDAVYLEN